MTDIVDRLNNSLSAGYSELRKEAAAEITQLRAKIEQVEKQEPIAYLPRSGTQPAPIEQDTSVRKAWARFSNELHRSPDAPYPGMADAFEQHFSQSFTDREWRSESATWAAAWKAAKRHGAQAQPAPSSPEGWREGVEDVAAMLQKKADDYAEEYGYDDTGGLSFGRGMGGEIKMDYYNHLIELIEEVRAMLAAAPEAKP